MRRLIIIFCALLLFLVFGVFDIGYATNSDAYGIIEFYTYKSLQIIGLISIIGILILILVIGREVKNVFLSNYGKMFFSVGVIKFVYVFLIEKQITTDVSYIQKIIFLNLSMKFIIIYSLIFFISFVDRLDKRFRLERYLYHINFLISLIALFLFILIDRQKGAIFLYNETSPLPIYLILEAIVITGGIISFLLLFKRRNNKLFRNLLIFIGIYGIGEILLPLLGRKSTLISEALQNGAILYLFLAIFLTVALRHFRFLRKLFMFSEEVLKEKLDIQKSFEILVGVVYEMYSDLFEKISFYYLKNGKSYKKITSIKEDSNEDDIGELVLKDSKEHWLFESKSDVIVLSTIEMDKYFDLDKTQLQIISNYNKVVLVPIKSRKSTIGFLICYTMFSNFELNGEIKEGLLIFKNFSKALLLQIERIEKIKALSAEDELTGLFNRRFFIKELITESLNCDRYKAKFCLAFFDMDNLKVLNDVYGHAVGDRAIKIIANVIRSNIRKTDIPARLGGDEFAVIFKNCSDIAIMDRINKIKTLIENESKRELPEKIHVSCGIAIYPDDTKSLDELIKIADSRMYEEKIKNRGER